MANMDKKVVHGKVHKEKNSNRKFKIEKGETSEVDIDVDILEDGNYVVEKLEAKALPEKMPDGNPVYWFNNFSIKKNGQYINQRYRVRIPDLSHTLKEKKAQLVVFNGNGELYYYAGIIEGDTFELNDGDPAVGHAP